MGEDKMKPAALVAILLAIPLLLAPQSRLLENTNTYGLINGRMWRIMSPDSKLMYLTGVAEGMIRLSSKQFSDSYKPGELNAGEVREAVDRFFSEPENVLIPAIDALHVVSMKADGRPQPEIDIQLSALRGIANGAPERKN
jgi:hypothetical protein